MTKPYIYKATSLLVCFLLLSAIALSQSSSNTVVLKKNTSFTSSAISGFSELVIDHPNNGTVNLSNVSGGFDIEYTPDSSFVGYDTVVVEYLTMGSAPMIDYAVFTFDVRHSILNVQNDYYAVVANAPYAHFDVGNNDTGSDGPIKPSDIVTVQNGYAYVLHDSLFFKPRSNFDGIAVLTYKACDTLGYCTKGQVQFIVVDSSNIATDDTLNLFTAENVDVQLLLPDSGFTAAISPGLGILQNDLNGQVYTYQPLQNTNGVDSFEMVNADGLSRYVIVNIIDVPDANQRVVPDYVYTHKNTSVSFDVMDNDVINTGNVSSYTQTSFGNLTKISSTEFEYVPNNNFVGVDKFTYTSCMSGSDCETTVVKIYVGNLNPDNRSNYNLVTPKNRPIVINYDVPLSNFMFQIAQAPQNGSIDIYPGYDTLLIGCEEVRGHNLVVYSPDQDYVGFDEFDLEYCVDSSNCQLVKVKVDVLDMQLDSVCVCADDCVWPGDVDYDGKVGMKDLLTLGWHVGKDGVSRPYASSNTWYGQYCPDWTESQANNENLKHADIDGDGEITVADTIGIVNFFDNVHSILTEPINEGADYPISLEIASPADPQIGDFVVVNVLAGSQSYPALDLHGLHLNLDFDPRIIDTSTLEMNFAPNSWLVNNDACLDMVHHEGKNIQGGLSRVDANARAGFGIVATVGFIVEDDIDGLSTDGSSLNYTVQLTNSSIMKGNGEIVQLSDIRLPLTISLDNEEQSRSEDIVLYPNPAPNRLNLALNGGEEIESIQVFDLSGRMMYQEESIDTRFHHLSTQSLQDGIYILKMRSSSGMTHSKKFQVIH
jgi:hypothetical protein